MEIETWAVANLTNDPNNARTHDKANLDAIAASLAKFGQRKPIVITADGVILAGNGTVAAAKQLGWKQISATVAPADWDAATAKAYALADNRTAELAEWDQGALATQLVELETEGWDLAGLGFDTATTVAAAAANDEIVDKGALQKRFIVPPFSTLDGRAGYWKARKKKWLSTGIKSEIGRGDDLLGLEGLSDITGDAVQGTSIFDPVICEITYEWFSKPGSNVLDPFAGGSVRGVVAATLDRNYTGIDLRAEQIRANNLQWAEIGDANKPTPTWIPGDSLEMDTHLPDGYKADLIFSCPPYADLEVYSDNPADLSNMDYAQFVDFYGQIIAKAVNRLNNDRFIVWVVGEARDKKGNYYGFVADTIKAFQNAGAELYNEAIIISPVGTLPIRAGKQFTASRKLGKAHQNYLVFVKGDSKKATDYLGAIDLGDFMALLGDDPAE